MYSQNANMVRLCLYIEGQSIADITGIWMYEDPPELKRTVELSCYYKDGGFFCPRQGYFILKSKFNDHTLRYLFFELKWLIRNIQEIREGGNPQLIIIMDSL